MYKELVQEKSAGNEWVRIQPPCPEAEIEEAESVVGFAFPAELKALLRELNGDGWLLLSARQIIENVRRNREIFYPLFEEDFSVEAYRDRIDRFIFFATDGCGNYYGFRVAEDGRAEEGAIYFWDHEYIGDECCWKKVADSIADCITRYYDCEI